jgi:cardiolipin synthase
MANVHLVSGCRLTLLQSGAAYFPQLIRDIEDAQHSIYLETYIFAEDEIGRRIVDALIAAGLRGVSVCVLMDGFGSSHFPLAWLKELRAAGVEVQWFRREVYRFRMRRYRLRRLHRKLVVLDGALAFVGGININDGARGVNNEMIHRLDFVVRVEGDMASEIQAVMQRMWLSVTWANSSFHGKSLGRLVANALHVIPDRNIAILLRDNLRHRREIEHAYLTAIASATREVVIANAYFLPGNLFRRTLIHAARRGVRVVLLLQGKVEYRLQHYATQALYEQLLAAGVEIYEYQAGFLHAKVAVVDGKWATVGSSNIDPFSLLLAREANLVVSDRGFAEELRGKLMAEIARDAQRIEPVNWSRLGWGARMISRFSYAVIRMMIGVAGYGKHSV